MSDFYLSKVSPSWIGDPSTSHQEVLTLADILSVNSGTSATNASVSLVLGNAMTGEVYTRNALLWNAPGMYSVPLSCGSINSAGAFVPSATSTEAAQAVCYVRNDNWIVLSIRDTRTQKSQPGNAAAGETTIYAQGAPGRVILKKDGSINLYTLDNGSSMGVFIAPETNTISAVNTLGFGMQIDESGFSAFASSAAPSGGALTLEESGKASLVGTGTTQIDGANIVLGSNPALSAITNAATINPAGLVSFLTALVAKIATITSTTPGATAMATITPQLASLAATITSKKTVIE